MKHAPSRFKWLPNAITSSRLLLGMLAFVAAIQQNWAAALWLFVAALLTDFLDGLVARKCNAASTFGEEFDAVADFTIVVLGVLSLGATGHISWWLVTTVFAIGLLIASDRLFKQPVWQWRAMVAVASLFVAWIGIVWFYAYLAYGWSWFYVLITILTLMVCALLKRNRLTVWLNNLKS